MGARVNAGGLEREAYEVSPGAAVAPASPGVGLPDRREVDSELERDGLPVVLGLLAAQLLIVCLSGVDDSLRDPLYIARNCVQVRLDEAEIEAGLVACLLEGFHELARESVEDSEFLRAVLCTSAVLPLILKMPPESRFPKALLLGIAFANNIGGMTTPVASPQNAIALNALASFVRSCRGGIALHWLPRH